MLQSCKIRRERFSRPAFLIHLARLLLATAMTFSTVSPAPCQIVPWWEKEQDDWNDITVRSARLSLEYPEVQNIQWLADYDRIAFRAVAGSISTSHFLIKEEARLIAELTPRFYFRYYHNRFEDFRNLERINRIEFEYRHQSGLLLGAMGSGAHQKRYVDLGGFAGWMTRYDRFVRLYFNAHRFLYNVKNKGSGEYIDFPYQFMLQSVYALNECDRIYLDGFTEIPWEFQNENPAAEDEPIFGEGWKANFTFRFEHAEGSRALGVEYNLNSSYLSQKFNDNQNLSEEYYCSKLKFFYLRQSEKNAFEFSFPVSYIVELTESADSSATEYRDRRKLEFYPEASYRWYFANGVPYFELSTLYLTRDLDQVGNVVGLEDKFEGNFRLGFAFGAYFNRPDSLRGNSNSKRPYGQIRFRVMQNLDRNWIGNFGGGSAILMVNW